MLTTQKFFIFEYLGLSIKNVLSFFLISKSNKEKSIEFDSFIKSTALFTGKDKFEYSIRIISHYELNFLIE